MGLDITAYSRVTRVDDTTDVEDYEQRFYWDREDSERFDFVHPQQDYQDRMVPITPGVYRIDGERMHVRAGSYSGYNAWREWLSILMIGVFPRTVWQAPALFQDKPFYELINFSDCEGVIGTEACKRLAAAFAEHQSKVDVSVSSEEQQWFREKYNQWRKAFEIAADNGYVDFH